MIALVDARLAAPAAAMPALAAFYRDGLGLPAADGPAGELALRVGESTLRFAPAGGAAEPFHHFALLVPGDRFDTAAAWIGRVAEPLADPDTGETTFHFRAWQAPALYVHDPAGNIVELIAHEGIGEAGADGPFAAGELLGLSELGLVCPDPAAAAAALAEIGLDVWSGTVAEPGRLAFVGERARTLILSPVDRPWMPTGRPAEVHPVAAVVAGAGPGERDLPGTPHRVATRA